jgi:hypothetical protein
VETETHITSDIGSRWFIRGQGTNASRCELQGDPRATHFIDKRNGVNGVRFCENSNWTEAMASDKLTSKKKRF